MPMFYDFFDDDCPWHYFDGSYKILLGACLIVFGLCGVLLNGWLFISFLYSHLLTNKSHILVLNLCSASFARNLLSFPFASASAFSKRWIFGTACCKFFAFLNQFLGVFQLTSLLVFCLERYYLVIYYNREKELRLIFYWFLVLLCWISSFLLAVPPLLGLGSYTCDVTNTVCTYLWPSLESPKQTTFSISLVILGGILPVFTILYYIVKVIPLERRYYKGEILKEQRRLTKSVHASSCITLLLWIPALLLIIWQWIPLLIYGYRIHVPPALVLLATMASEAATSVPALTYLVADERVRAALIGRMKKHYALLRPDRAKKYERVKSRPRSAYSKKN